MKLSSLNYFMKLYETKNITHAAEELYISRQALSKSISSLEKELNVSLIYQKHGGIEFTEAGIYLYEKLLPIFKELNKTLQNIQKFEENFSITLGVDYMTTYIYDTISLDPFFKDHPSILLNRKIATPDDLEIGFQNHAYDIVLSHMHVPSDTITTKICSIPFGILLTSKDPYARKKFLTIEDLEKRKIYATGGNLLFIEECNTFFKEIHSSCRVLPTETNELFTNLKFIENNDVLFLTTGYYLHSIRCTELYHFIPFKYTGKVPLPNHDVYMYHSKEFHKEEFLKIFETYLKSLPNKF